MYTNHMLYQINEWSDIRNHDIIYKLLSNNDNPPKEFFKIMFPNNFQLIAP